jgi:methyl-accepting chemotaxis protein
MIFINYLKRRLQFKLIVAVLCVVVFFIFLTTIYSINQTNKTLMNQHSRHGDFIVDSLVTQHIQNLLSLNYPAIRIALGEIGIKDPLIISIQVFEGDKLVAEYVQENKSTKYYSVYEKPVIYKSAKFEREIGKIIVMLSDDDLKNYLNKHLITSIIQSLIVILGIVFLMYFFLNVQVIKPIKTLENSTKKVGEGNLNINIELKNIDEFGILAKTFNATINNLKNLVINIKDSIQNSINTAKVLSVGSTKVNDSMESINNSVKEITEGSEQLKVFVHENVITFDELNENINKVSQISNKTAIEAKKANETGNLGAKNVELANEKLNIIHGFINESVNNVSNLGLKITKIEDFVEVIKDISEQTNLLALNANIEAARAGDAGRGFGVVADAVKNLSNETKNATNEINNLIIDIQNYSNSTINNMKKGNEEFKEGISIITNALESFYELRDKLLDITKQIEDINKASIIQLESSKQSKKSLDLVNTFSDESSKKLNKVNDNINEVYVAINEMNKSVESLSNNSNNLNSLINQFKI